MEEIIDYNLKYSLRTKKFAVSIIKLYANHCKKTEELRVIGKQFLRSGTSVAANFRAYIRGRSVAERYSKICIVVEEVDETLFWFELMEESDLIDNSILAPIKQESLELLKIFSVTKSKLKTN
ncbi:MAG: four helix bundle protein [Bacteroidota bacterium]|nr:four helix bundle protein [Bacteroidota bacterium]